MSRKPNLKIAPTFDRDQLAPGENLCEHCTAKCCRYFALPIDTPKTQRDFDFMRWYLLHERASIFVEGPTWYLLVHTTCKHLLDDHRCGIYHTRPQICREYTTDECEFEDSFTYDRYFETPEQIHEFANAIFYSAETFRTPCPDPTQLPIL